MTSTSLPPPYEADLLRSVTDTSSSSHLKNLFSVIVTFVIFLYNQYFLRWICCFTAPPSRRVNAISSIVVWFHISITIVRFICYLDNDWYVAPPCSHPCWQGLTYTAINHFDSWVIRVVFQEDDSSVSITIRVWSCDTPKVADFSHWINAPLPAFLPYESRSHPP